MHSIACKSEYHQTEQELNTANDADPTWDWHNLGACNSHFAVGEEKKVSKVLKGEDVRLEMRWSYNDLNALQAK